MRQEKFHETRSCWDEGLNVEVHQADYSDNIIWLCQRKVNKYNNRDNKNFLKIDFIILISAYTK